MNEIYIKIGLLILKKIMEERELDTGKVDALATIAHKDALKDPAIQDAVATAIHGLLVAIFERD